MCVCMWWSARPGFSASPATVRLTVYPVLPGYSESYVPFCGLAVMEALSGEQVPQAHEHTTCTLRPHLHLLPRLLNPNPWLTCLLLRVCVYPPACGMSYLYPYVTLVPGPCM